MLRANIDWKSAISIQRGQFDPKFQVKGVAPPIILHGFVRPMNSLPLCCWQFSHKLYSRLSSSEVRFYTESGRFAFSSPLWGLGATYDDHLRLIRTRVVDFLLVLIELFSLGVTAEALRANIRSKSAISIQLGPVETKFQVEGIALHQSFFFVEN